MKDHWIDLFEDNVTQGLPEPSLQELPFEWDITYRNNGSIGNKRYKKRGLARMKIEVMPVEREVTVTSPSR